MPRYACSTPGCPSLHDRTGKCASCRGERDKGRRPDGNPYASRAHHRFRDQVLARDPVCVECLGARSTVADHHPAERWELVEAGADPNDPAHGRGLCKSCHDSKTAKTHELGGSH